MRYECMACGYVYDPAEEGVPFDQLPDDWVCPICGVGKDLFEESGADGSGGDDGSERSGRSTEPPAVDQADRHAEDEAGLTTYLSAWKRSSDELETTMSLIHQMAVSGAGVIEPMRTRKAVLSWDEILIQGAQLARLPLNEDEPVSTRTVIGPGAARPLEIDTPIIISHMSYGALSREIKIALARGSASAGTAICSGEGGVLPAELEASCHYIFEYVPNRYSVTEEILERVSAIEIKIGQSAKPGMGGHLPGHKVTAEIAAVRGFPAGEDITSPARFHDISDAETLQERISWLRQASGGKPIGVKLAAGHIEADLEVALAAGPDFITIDGRAGATGAAPKVIKDSTSIPTIYAIARARRFLDRKGASKVSLIATGGLRVSTDIAKALALGADAAALASAALMAAGCQQYRICHTGRCPVGIATQDPQLRARLDESLSARRLASFLEVTTSELRQIARLTGHADVHELGTTDLATTSSEVSRYTGIIHAGGPPPVP